MYVVRRDRETSPYSLPIFAHRETESAAVFFSLREFVLVNGSLGWSRILTVMICSNVALV